MPYGQVEARVGTESIKHRPEAYHRREFVKWSSPFNRCVDCFVANTQQLKSLGAQPSRRQPRPCRVSCALEDLRCSQLAVMLALWHGSTPGMRFLHLHLRQRNLTTSLLLAMFLFRAYVPIGYMPAGGTPFLLKICPSGIQATLPAHHLHHDMGGHTHFENCPFGSAPAAGPIFHFIAFEPTGQIVSRPVVAFEPLRLGVRLQRAHQPRGPPSFA